MDTSNAPRAVMGPFTAREATFLAGAALLALASLFSFGRTRGDFAVVVLCIAAPVTLASFYAWRRQRSIESMSLGSFTLDQLGAAASVAALVVSLGGLGGGGGFAQFLAIVGSLCLVAATLGAHWIGRFKADFVEDPDVPLLRRRIRLTGATGSPLSRPDAGGSLPSDGFASGRGGDPAGAGAGSGAEAAGASAGSSVAGDAGGSEAEQAPRFGARAPQPGAWSGTQPGTQGTAGGGAQAPASGSGTGVGTGAGGAAAPGPAHHVQVPRVPLQTSVISATSGGPAPAPGGPATPFWFAVPDARGTLDRATGTASFTLTPGTWWLAVRRAEHGLVVRHDDGREALLTDTEELEIG